MGRQENMGRQDMTSAEAALALLAQAHAERSKAPHVEMGLEWEQSRARKGQTPNIAAWRAQYARRREAAWRVALAKRCERWAEKLMLGEWPK